MGKAYPQVSLASRITSNPKLILVAAIVLFVLAWPNRPASSTGDGGGSAFGSSKCPVHGKRFGIMMDAGSTGSRTHIFEFLITPGGPMKLVAEVFEELKPGLSSFAADPQAAAKSLVPLMDIAARSVPAADAACTPVALKATAGLRLLGQGPSDAILTAVEALLRQYPFHVPAANAAIVMDSKDEGPYAWLTVNFLLETLAPGKQTAAILDMGGASTQIVFVPDAAAALRDAPESYIYATKVNGASFKAYQHSYLGLGLKEAAKSIVKAAALLASTAKQSFACFPADYTETVGNVVVKTDAATQNFDLCKAFVAETLFRKASVEADSCPQKPCAIGNVFQPSLTTAFSGPIYAFSYFYDRMEHHLPENGEITVADYRVVGKEICDSASDQAEAVRNKGTMCMDVAFLYAMLTDGYGLPDSQTLHIKKKIDSIETAWALGAMIVAMNL